MRLHFLACLLALGLGGCDLTGSDTPPTIGTFAVHGSLDSDTCYVNGAAADDSLDQTAVVGGYPGHAASFSWTGGHTFTGTAASAAAGGTYAFRTSQSTSSSEVDPVTGQPLCTLTQASQVTFTITPTPVAPVDGGVADAGADAGNVDGGTNDTYVLAGTYSESFAATGAGCAALLSSNGGSYAALPCRVEYTLTGTAPR